MEEEERHGPSSLVPRQAKKSVFDSPDRVIYLREHSKMVRGKLNGWDWENRNKAVGA